MKFVVVTFAIAALVQLSMAGPILRQKRSESFIEVYEESLRTIKTFAPRANTLIRNTLKNIPRTHAYSRYIALLEEYLKDAERLENTPGNCFEKSLAGLEMMTQMFVALEALTSGSRSPEAKEIGRLFEVNDGAHLATDLINFANKMDNLDVEKGLEEITERDVLRIAPLIAEVC